MGPCHVQKVAYVPTTQIRTVSANAGGGAIQGQVVAGRGMGIGMGGIGVARVGVVGNNRAQQIYRRRVNNIWVGILISKIIRCSL